MATACILLGASSCLSMQYCLPCQGSALPVCWLVIPGHHPGSSESLLLVPQASRMLRFADDYASDPPRLRPLKLRATKWHSSFGFSLAFALACPRLISQLPL